MPQGNTYILTLIARVMIFAAIFTVFGSIKKESFMKIGLVFKNIPIQIKRIYRLFRVKHRSEIVWNDLIKLHKQENWHFGQYDNEKYLHTTFVDENNNSFGFHYQITEERLVYRAVISSGFDEENTNAVMVLSSHLNSLLYSGIVRVDIANNYVEFVLSGNLLVYNLYPNKIHSDLDRHFEITKDLFWAYSYLLNSGEEPVFVIAELVKRNNKRYQE